MRKPSVVRVDRFMAAHRAWGGSRQQLAEVSGVSPSTLSRLATAGGGTKAVSAKTLSALEEALQVPAEWLTGEREDLPYVPQWEGPKGHGPSLWEHPTAGVVRWSWLLQLAEGALRRDLADWYGEEAGNAYDTWGHALLGVFTELAAFVSWRLACLQTVSRNWKALWPSDPSPSVDWLTHLLEPWFAGRAYLNTAILGRVFEAVLTSELNLFREESDVRDEDSRWALVRYEEACSTFIAERQEEMYEELAKSVVLEDQLEEARRAPLGTVRWHALLARLEVDVARAEGGDDLEGRYAAAWAELHRRVRVTAQAFAQKPFPGMTTPLEEEELEDIVQEVCVKLQKREVRDKIRAARTPAGYLVAMLRNAAGDYLRRGERRMRVHTQAGEAALETSLSASLEDVLAEELDEERRRPPPGEHASSEARALQRALARLPPLDRELLREHYWNERSVGEIAAGLGISPTATGIRLRRLQERLRALMEAESTG